MEGDKKINCRKCEKLSGCFQLLYPDQLDFINSRKTRVSYLKGETLFKQGAFAPSVIYILEGLVRVYLQTARTKQLNIRLARPGDFLAFSSLFGADLYNYSAVAVKNTTICMIEKEAIKKLLLKNTDFSVRITTRNCRNETRYLEIIQNISSKQMRGKLASALLYLSSGEFGDDVFYHLSRQEIAGFASITLESAVKFIKEFEKEGLLELRGKDIKITNIEKLEAIASRG